MATTLPLHSSTTCTSATFVWRIEIELYICHRRYSIRWEMILLMAMRAGHYSEIFVMTSSQQLKYQRADKLDRSPHHPFIIRVICLCDPHLLPLLHRRRLEFVSVNHSLLNANRLSYTSHWSEGKGACKDPLTINELKMLPPCRGQYVDAIWFKYLITGDWRYMLRWVAGYPLK